MSCSLKKSRMLLNQQEGHNVFQAKEQNKNLFFKKLIRHHIKIPLSICNVSHTVA